MKRLTRYILTEHIGPFLFAFFVITFLLIIDYVPKIVDHVIDKDLSLGVVLEIISLNLAWMLALSVPMAVLVATLMAFGRLTADFEITAIKASGINLVRMIVPLLVAASVIMGGMIYFNDQVLPDLNRRARLLWGDISAMRPTLVFRSGVFISDIPGFLVLIENIDHSTSKVEGVHITDTKVAEQPRIVVAEHGYLKMTENNTNMQFTLYDGQIYSLNLEQPEKDRRVDFENYVINVHDVRSELVRTESDFRNDREMGIAEMEVKVSRAREAMEPFRNRIQTQVRRTVQELVTDDFSFGGEEEMSDSAALRHVKTEAAELKRQVETSRQQILGQRKTVNKYSIEIHKKYSIPAASLAFILLGAPLGVITKKGGMGTAIAVSILLFIIYWAFLIGGEDLADRGLVSPFWAMWAANIGLAIIGVYLLWIVATEKPVFFIFGARGPKE